MNKVYVLQKDLPYLKAGAEYHYTGINYECNEGKFIEGCDSDHLRKTVVENNPEWFKLKEEKTEVEIHDYIGNGKYLHLTSSHQIKREKYDAIKKAIEFVLNN